jgi:shikimate kinase/shikimate kinase/3-dehydroquinate synthase|tara:strand:- start:190 stop:702 length:513 start_codon:yes stop_codon:yes gene_type:complete
MKSKENIVFLGMMGSGKTTIGSLVSKKLHLDFFDTDQLIEKELNMKISKIFETKGEKFFRKIEEKITLETLKKDGIILSIGGGAFLNNNIRREILNNHLSFWLKWDKKILINRIKKSYKRPLASKATNYELVDLIKKRSNIYSKALFRINCDNLTKQELVNKILEIYETH